MLKLWPRPPHHISLAPSGSGAAKGGSPQRCSAFSGERLNPRGGEKEAGEDRGVAAFGMPGAQFRGSYLKGVSCPERGGS